MDWAEFQRRARHVVPKQELKARRCWIGVHDHRKSTDDDFEETDFVWMIGHNKISMQKIREIYEMRHKLTGIRIGFKGRMVDQSDVVKSFLLPGDDLVVFVAIDTLSAMVQHQTRETAAPDMDSETPTTEIEHLRERLRAMNDSAQGTPERPRVKEERQSPALFRDASVFQDEDVELGSSFDPNKIFNEASPKPSIPEDLGPIDQRIRSVIELQDPDILEAGVCMSLKIMGCLKEKFSQHSTSNAYAASWVEQIEELLPQSERRRTVVGVVGNTGAGKSSVINAILDEERLVPTNCMRACTAVVTEISWNSSTEPSSKYRAEIEFISQADWEKELTVLLREFLSDNGTLSREVQDPNSDAGIAWAKFHAVYPSIPKGALSECDIPSLMSKRSVVDVLGTTKRIRAAGPQYFYQELQRYVDSKEKVSKRDKNKEKASKPAFQVEYWPLIKVVKIHTKSHALSTGAVIVDLPGVHDSNAARAAVAQGYIKQCTGLWIVAPINRAVDDKAARTLLGDSFKRQLKYDGGFSSVTFICSKTDDISVTEAIDSLGLEDKVTEFKEQQDQCNEQIKQIQSKIEDLNESREVYKVARLSATEDIELWETLQEQLDEGQPAFAPLPKTNKRKKAGSSKQSRKKKQAFDDDTDDDFQDFDDEDDGESDSDDEVTCQAERIRLCEADVKEKLKELRETKKNARREGIQMKHSIDELKPQVRELETRKDEITANISRICIAGRNCYSKSAIQQDFAAGIKEIDQENAAEEDEDNFNPDEEKRDYDQVARSLPVFCVSSREYQKLCGRMQKDDGVPGFVTLEETEVPQLQAHCKKLTEGGRIQTSRTFLTKVCQMLNTYSLWVSTDGTGLTMTSEDKQKQISFLQRRLSELTVGLESAIRACIREMRSEMKSQIFDKCPELINEAIQTAPATAHAWGHKDQGGLAWSSYKAVVRRDGVYHSAVAGHCDFNTDLVDPIKKNLATGWERAFQARLPRAVDMYINNSSTLLHGFHEAIEERTKTNGVCLASLSILKVQICHFEKLFKDLGGTLLTQMTELQREANREFTPCIANIMHTAYDACTVEHGPGSYKRMKEHMANHVEQERHGMFHEAIKTVVKHLDDLCKALQESMEAKAEEIFVLIKRDYTRVLGDVAGNQPVHLQSKEERQFKSEVREILEGVDAQFEPIGNGEIALEEAAKTNDADSQGEEYINVDVEDNRGIFDSVHESIEGDVDEAGPTHTEPSVQKQKGGTGTEHADLRVTIEDDMNEEI